jgi:mRNA interferase RelE/StbE
VYAVRIARRAERNLRHIRQGDPRAYARIAGAIRSLANEPRPTGASKLTAFDPPAWRLRVGAYRIVYEINEGKVLVLVVNLAPCGEAYR